MDEQKTGTRLNKYLSEHGICSRREADRMIEAGRVRIGERIAETGERVFASDTVYVDGTPVGDRQEELLLKFYKPRGIVCTESRKDPDNIVDYLNYPVRIFTVGRLDKESEGLLLLTNQGDLVNRIMRAGNYHEKEYIVTVQKKITEGFLEGMARGVYLEELDVTTRPCKVKMLGEKTFSIVLTQGYNRQIRRMCKVFGYRVTELKRIRVMNIRVGDLKPGELRSLSEKEKTRLFYLLKDSTSTPDPQGSGMHTEIGDEAGEQRLPAK